jgi:hypothetical protein
MLCHEFEMEFEQAAGAQLPANAAAHLGDCASCRAMAADFEAICASAHSLQDDVGEEPPARVWQNVRAQLAAEGIIREPQAAGAGSGWLAGLLGWAHRPALVAGYALVALLAVGVIWQREPASTSYEAAALPAEALATQRDLSSVEAQAISNLQPGTSEVDASLRRNLDIVDKFIALCEKTVRDEPQNEDARQYLYSAYQQKAELLTTAMEHDWTGE